MKSVVAGALLGLTILSSCGESSSEKAAGGTGATDAGRVGGNSAGASETAGSGGTDATVNPSGGSSGSGTGAAPAVPPTCSPLPAPTGATVTAGPSDASELDTIVADADSGTTILLDPGTYSVDATLQLCSPGVTLRSSTDDAESVIIDGAASINELVAISASDVTVAHVTLTRAVDHLVHAYPAAEGQDVTGIRLYGLRLVDSGEQFVKVNPIEGQEGYVDQGRIECSVFQMTSEGRPNVETLDGTSCYTGGIDVHAGWGWEVRNNRFSGIYCETGFLAEHAIHFWVGSRDTLVENNVIIDCARGIGFGLGTRASDRVYADSPQDGADLGHYDGIIRNNVIWADHPYYDTGIELQLAREPQVLHNTVVSGSGATGFFRSIDIRYAETHAIIANNLTRLIGARDGATADLTTNLENTLLGDFVSVADLDFHLAGDAAEAIDQGTVVPDSGLDIDGQAHDVGPPDLGADEYTP